MRPVGTVAALVRVPVGAPLRALVGADPSSAPVPVRRLVAILACGAALGLSACSAPTPSRNELTAALVRSGIPADVARCTANAVSRSLSKEQIGEIVERGPGGAPPDDPDRTDDPVDKMRAAMTSCRARLPTPTLPSATPPSGSEPGATSGPTSGASEPATDGTGASFDTVSSTAVSPNAASPTTTEPATTEP